MAKKFPVQIDNWERSNGEYSPEGLLNIIYLIVEDVLKDCKRPGILLSGGLDSSLLAIVANKFRDVPCFTISNLFNHPDVVAATQLAKEFDLDLRIYLPSSQIIHNAKSQVETDFAGDEAVFLALEFANYFIKDILATDGIDEQMGGYWWHINRNEQFPTVEGAFEHFWDELKPKHLIPMWRSAIKIGLNIHWIFLYKAIIDYVSRIPLEERVENGVGKAFWHKVARLADVPEWVIQRPKRGFVHAFSK